MKSCGLLLVFMLGISAALPAQDIKPRNVLCPGGRLTLSATAENVDYYKWFKDDTLITGINGNILQVRSPGVYSVVAFNLNGCRSDTSYQAVSSAIPIIAGDDTVTVYPGETVSINVAVNDRSMCSIIDNATISITKRRPTQGRIMSISEGRITYGLSRFAEGNDFFTYVIQDKAGNTSNEAMVTIRVADKCGTVYPNPATEYVKLDVYNPNVQFARLCDMHAQVLAIKQVEKESVTFSMQPYDEGMYFIHLVDKFGNILCINKAIKMKPTW